MASALVYWDGGFSPNSVVVYGPYDDDEAAKAAGAQQQFPANYYVNKVYPPPPVVPPASNLPVLFDIDQVLVVKISGGGFGQSPCVLYGTFATDANAEAFIAQQQFPGMFLVTSVEPPL